MILLAPLVVAGAGGGASDLSASRSRSSSPSSSTATTPRQPRTCWRWSVAVTGQPATEALFAEIRDRLEQSGRFAGVDVRKRYLSIDDPTRVLVVIVVDEHEGVSEDDLTPGPWKRFSASSMWLPVLQYQEGYGFTYGARFSFVDRLGPRSRISVPLTWGGERQAQLELERTFDGPRGARGRRRRRRSGARTRSTRSATSARRCGAASRPRRASWLRAGAGGRFSQVGFGELDEPLTHHRRGRRARHPARPGAAAKRRLRAARCRAPRLRHERAGRARRRQPGASRRTRLTFDGRGYVGSLPADRARRPRPVGHRRRSAAAVREGAARRHSVAARLGRRAARRATTSPPPRRRS